MNNYNQPDVRDRFAYLLGIFSPLMKAEVESVLRSMSANSYSSDFTTLMDVINGKIMTSCINKKVIDNAGECYKQVNKSLLNFRNLNMTEKTRESQAIDFEARRLKDEWTQQLRCKGILII